MAFRMTRPPLSLPQLPILQVKSLSHPFTPLDIQRTIAQLPVRKSLGLDVYTNTFYKFLSHKPIDPLSSVFNLAAERGTFPAEMLLLQPYQNPKKIPQW